METRPRFTTVSPPDYRLDAPSAPTPPRSRRLEANSDRDLPTRFQLEPNGHPVNATRPQAVDRQNQSDRLASDSPPQTLYDRLPVAQDTLGARTDSEPGTSGTVSESKAKLTTQDPSAPPSQDQNAVAIITDLNSVMAVATLEPSAGPSISALAGEIKAAGSDKTQPDQGQDTSYPTSATGLEAMSAGLVAQVMPMLTPTPPIDLSQSTPATISQAMKSEALATNGVTLKSTDNEQLTTIPAQDPGSDLVQTAAHGSQPVLAKASALATDKTSGPDPKGDIFKLGDSKALSVTEGLSLLAKTDQTPQTSGGAEARPVTEKPQVTPEVQSKPDRLSAAVTPETKSPAAGQEFLAPIQITPAQAANMAPVQIASSPYAAQAKVMPSQPGLHLNLANPDAMAALSAQIHKRLGEKSTDFEIQLHPADLGQVTIRLSIGHDGNLTANLGFDTPAAQAQFKAQSDELRRGLEQQGFQLSDASLSFSQNQKDNQQQSASGSAYQNASQGRLADAGGAGGVSSAYGASPGDLTAPARDDDYALLGGRTYRINLNLVA